MGSLLPWAVLLWFRFVMRVKIYGYGWVGKAMHSLFPTALIHDPALGMVAEEVADVALVCVPTPGDGGKLDTSIVWDIARDAEEELIIIRSTLNPGTCDELEKLGRNIVFMPEYLGESVAHPLLDETQRKFLIIGGRPENRRKAIDLFNTVFNANVTIRQMSNLEAEVVKLSENRAIMFKVMQCQELYDACQYNGVDYYTIREAVYGDDPRFNLWFTSIYPDKRGASSKCIPKDVYAWSQWADWKDEGYDKPYHEAALTKAMLKYNDELITWHHGD